MMTRTGSISWEVSWCVAGPNLCSMDAQTTWDCFVVLSASDKGNEDRQHFDCGTWLHKVDHKKSDALRFHRRGPLGLKALPCQLDRSRMVAIVPVRAGFFIVRSWTKSWL